VARTGVTQFGGDPESPAGQPVAAALPGAVAVMAICASFEIHTVRPPLVTSMRMTIVLAAGGVHVKTTVLAWPARR
jgi:hypothetical protein